jgi:hypothetical protein
MGVSRGLITMAPTLSRQVPYAVRMHDPVTSGNAEQEALSSGLEGYPRHDV